MKRLSLLLLPFLLLAGCEGRAAFGEYRELDKLVLVDVLGLDAEREKNTVSVSTASGGGTLLLKSTAPTIRRALAEMQNYTEEQYVFYGHTHHLLLGEKAAAGAFRRSLEFVERSDELRLDTWLYVVRGGTAEAAVTQPDCGSSVGDLLDSLVKDVELMSDSHVSTCAEAAEALAERNCALVAAVRLAEPENIVAEERRRTLLSAGYAIIAGESLAGWLDPDLARGANLLMSCPGSDVIQAPDGAGGMIAARLTDSRASFLPEYREGELIALTIRLELQCILEELGSPLDLRDGEIVHRLEEGIAAVEEARVREVLRISRELEADFCDLGSRVRRASPLAFDAMKGSWRDRFPTLPVTLELQVQLERGSEGDTEGYARSERAAG